MIIELNITESFGAIDYVNAGGLTTYIDIALTESLLENFKFKLFNFVLNTIDAPILDAIKKQAPTKLTQILTDEGFLIVKRATLNFEKVKSCDSMLTYTRRHDEFDLERSWGGELDTGDKVYDIGGQLCPYPELRLNLAIVSPNKITLTLCISDCIYIENYQNLIIEIDNLNSSANITKNSHNLLNIDFRNKHLTPNFDTGYRTYSRN